MEGAPPPLKASFIPPTLTQLPLWCKNKRTNKNNHPKTNKNTGSLWGWMGGKNWGYSPFPQGRKEKYIHGGEAVAESCPNTAL